MDGTWIIFSGTGGELDRKFARCGEEALILHQLVKGDGQWNIIDHGDTIQFVEGWTEDV